MNLTFTDYLLVRLAQKAAPVLRRFGEIETEFLRERLKAIPIDQPVFLTGLARAGTTILLQELAATGLFATHRYRDFPFLMTPFVWNRLLDLFSAEQPPVMRPHGDRIEITRESAEAFEEPLWQHFFPEIHSPTALHRLRADRHCQQFERFFREHIQKVLLLRGRPRYLSKGNYNLARIEYLARVFPDARFIVPIRHPVTHVHSLVRQHERFTAYAAEDPRVGRYLAAAGHYEFGPQRVPIRLNEADGDRTQEAWSRGEEHRGYAIQWAQVYRHVDNLCRCFPALTGRIRVVRYEDLCSDPNGQIEAILSHAAADAVLFDKRSHDHVTAPPAERNQLPREQEEAIWEEVELVAAAYGYHPETGQQLSESEADRLESCLRPAEVAV